MNAGDANVVSTDRGRDIFGDFGEGQEVAQVAPLIHKTLGISRANHMRMSRVLRALTCLGVLGVSAVQAGSVEPNADGTLCIGRLRVPEGVAGPSTAGRRGRQKPFVNRVNRRRRAAPNDRTVIPLLHAMATSTARGCGPDRSGSGR